MKILAIFGAGGQGIEALEIARSINAVTPTWGGFIFVNNGDEVPPIDGVPVMSLEKAIELYSGRLEGSIAVGEPALRNKIADQLSQNNIPGANLISPGVKIPHTSSVGEGVCIFPNVFIASNTKIGRHVIISPNAVIGHDCVIEDNVVISAGAIISGMVNAKKNSYIGPGVLIKESITIGEGAVASIGSVVFKDIKDGDLVIGNPARPSIRSGEKIFKN